MTKIAFLGLGAMGVRMTARLVTAGHRVTAWNRTPMMLPGASSAPTPRAAVRGAAMVFAMLRDDAASHAVWSDPDTGAFAGMDRNALALDCSTLSPRHMRDLHSQAQSHGLRFVDAPLAGSRPQAEAGQLIFLAGGAERDVAEAGPILLAMGAAVHHAGGPGAGAVTKLMVNTLFAGQLALVAEVLAMAQASGLDPARVWDITAATPVVSPAAKGAAAAMIARSFAPAFPVDLVVKDLALALSMTATPMIKATHKVFLDTASLGFAAENITAVARTYLP